MDDETRTNRTATEVMGWELKTACTKCHRDGSTIPEDICIDSDLIRVDYCRHKPDFTNEVWWKLDRIKLIGNVILTKGEFRPLTNPVHLDMVIEKMIDDGYGYSAIYGIQTKLHHWRFQRINLDGSDHLERLDDGVGADEKRSRAILNACLRAKESEENG